MNPKLHLSLDVQNLQESIRFYSLLFEVAPTKVRPGYAKFDLESPAMNLTMQEHPTCCLQGLSHLGIRVDSKGEVLAYRARLTSAGMKVADEMGATCCYASQDKIWVNDPTGYRWEIYVFHGDVEQQPVAAKEFNCCA